MRFTQAACFYFTKRGITGYIASLLNSPLSLRMCCILPNIAALTISNKCIPIYITSLKTYLA